MAVAGLWGSGSSPAIPPLQTGLGREVGRTRDGAVVTAASPQRVEMHKEKVSRREIGSLTISKRFPSCQKVVAPPSPPCLEPYYRKPLNFSVLDDIGHGIKVSPRLR